MVWINVLGVPFKFWNLDFIKVIGDECGEFIAVSKSTLNKRRIDLASILASSSHDPIPSSLLLNINAKLVSLKVSYTSISVDLVDDEEEDIDHSDSFEDDDNVDVEDVGIASLNFSFNFVFANDF